MPNDRLPDAIGLGMLKVLMQADVDRGVAALFAMANIAGDLPANNSGNSDAADRPVVLEPPANGTIIRVVEFPPDSAWRNNADAKEAFSSIGAGHATDDSVSDPMMHKTATVDYLIVLKGEIWAILEDGEVCLKQGDVMVQRGTNHSWSVRTDEPCLLAAILVNATPL